MSFTTENSQIFDTDEVNYWIFHPIHFSTLNNSKLDLSRGLPFQERDGRRCESVNCHRLFANGLQDAHRLAIEKQNKDRETKKKDNITYRGHIYARVEAIHATEREGGNFCITHAPIPENNAHCDIELVAATCKPVRERLKEDLYEIFSDLVPYIAA